MRERVTSLGKCRRTSSITCSESRFLRSSIVSTIARISSRSLRRRRTASMVSRSCASPSSAKYSHWTGISTASHAASALIVSRPSDGGQSTNTVSGAGQGGAHIDRGRGLSHSALLVADRKNGHGRILVTRETFLPVRTRGGVRYWVKLGGQM